MHLQCLYTVSDIAHEIKGQDLFSATAAFGWKGFLKRIMRPLSVRYLRPEGGSWNKVCCISLIMFLWSNRILPACWENSQSVSPLTWWASGESFYLKLCSCCTSHKSSKSVTATTELRIQGSEGFFSERVVFFSWRTPKHKASAPGLAALRKSANSSSVSIDLSQVHKLGSLSGILDMLYEKILIVVWFCLMNCQIDQKLFE